MKVSLSEINIPDALMRVGFNDSAMEELVCSIRTHGLIHPITVRKVPEGYELVAGFRRLTAVTMLDWDKIRVTIHRGSKAAAEGVKMAENNQREAVSPIDEGEYFAKLMENQSLTQAQIADMAGVSEGYVSQRLGSLKWIEPVRLAITGGKIKFSHGRELARCKDVNSQNHLLLLAINSGAAPKVVADWVNDKNRQHNQEQANLTGETLAPVENGRATATLACMCCDTRKPVDEVSVMQICYVCREGVELAKSEGAFTVARDPSAEENGAAGS